MSVHKEITEHVNKQHKIIKKYLDLVEQREQAINVAMEQAKNQDTISTDKINRITAEINELSKSGMTPRLKYVTAEMVMDYSKKV